MTEILPEQLARHDQFLAALKEIFADAHIVARYSAPMLRALTAFEGRTEDLTIRGVPVTVTGPVGGLTIEEMHQTGMMLYALDLQPGSRIVVTAPGEFTVIPPHMDGDES